MVVNTNFTPWKTENFQAKWVNFTAMEELPWTWKPYFIEADLGVDIFVLVDKKDNGLMMSNSYLERMDANRAISNATGKVLLIGLGINLMVESIANNPEVTSVVVLEKELDVILNTKLSNPKVTILHMNCNDKLPFIDNYFDYGYVDPYDSFIDSNFTRVCKVCHFWKLK